MINNPWSYDRLTEIYNVKMLEFFVSKILNPILNAVSDYNLHSKFMHNYKNFDKETKTLKMDEIYTRLEDQTKSSNHYSLDWGDIEYSNISDPPLQ